MLLREQNDEIQVPVTIDINRERIDSSGFLHDLVITVGFVGLLLQPPNFALVDKTVRGDNEICVAVPIKIAGLDIGHTADVVQNRHRGKVRRAVVDQQPYTSHQVVRRPRSPEASDNNIQSATMPAGQDLSVSGVGQGCQGVLPPDLVLAVNPCHC